MRQSSVRAIRVAAVDLGASSGRVLAVEFSASGLRCTEAHRFPNRPVLLGERLHWDVLGLYQGVLDGLRAAGPVSSVGVDGWAVDYALVDRRGDLLGNPVHYRDERTREMPARVHRRIPAEELYATTGVQVQPFNTIYQLAAEEGSPALTGADQLLLIPDLMVFWLSGIRIAELTNASTTGLLDIRRRTWSAEVLAATGISAELLPALVTPGQRLGELRDQVRTDTGQPTATSVTAVASHDTASAVAAIPSTERFAFVSTGTWSLVGIELSAPVLTEASRRANFTNELGVDGTVRYLRNVMGLWLLQECLRAWGNPDLGPLLEAAAQQSPLQHFVDAASQDFLAPGNMPDRIDAACRATGQPVPQSRAATVRCILDSLALAHRIAVRQAIELSGQPVDVVHLVGGGAHNALLCQLTADACGLPLVAGPVEAAALGNALVQARSVGAVPDDLQLAREWLKAHLELTRYEPRDVAARWEAAERLIATGVPAEL
jgi:rhamnulokinase